MPCLEIDLPIRKPLFKRVRFAYLSKIDGYGLSDGGSLVYLRTMRVSGSGNGAFRSIGRNYREWDYLKDAGYHAQKLAKAFDSATFDAVITPPSRYPQSLTFKSAFVKSGKTGVDLSDLIQREKEVYAATGPNFEFFCNALTCKGGNDLSECRSLLIVDDILWRGITAAGVLTHLRRHGLSDEARIYLACPLWIG
ncbi:MAG: hypothetical protein M3Y08_07740 [Fibrobacterota bacterium]|nr:hypothetical protein [Fibrobacterota bacterium]